MASSFSSLGAYSDWTRNEPYVERATGTSEALPIFRRSGPHLMTMAERPARLQHGRSGGKVRRMAASLAEDDRELLERDGALVSLDGWLASVKRSGRGQLVFVAGEAGVGKTMLLRRFAAAARSARVLWGGCDPLATPAPLGPFVEIAAELRAASDALIAQGARPYEIARALLADLESEQLAVIVVEDLHWADDGTLDLLAYVGRRVERVSALVLATYRDDDLAPERPLRALLGQLASAPRVERFRLECLSPAAVEVLAGRAGRLGEEVFAVTRGNPFFVTELLAGPAGGVPPSLRDAVLARAAPLDAQARALLDAVALIPPEAELWLLEQVSDSGLDGLERCLEAGILESRLQAVCFRHELARLVIAEGVGPVRAVAIQRRVLSALEEACVEPARLVHHAEAAGDEIALLRHAVSAGRQATTLGAHREAAQQYDRAVAVSAVRPVSDRADLLEACAVEHYLVDDPETAIELQHRSVRLRRGQDPVKEGDAMRWLSRFYWFAGRGDDATAAGEQAVSLLEMADPGPELARAYSNLSQLRMLAHDSQAAIELGRRALRLAELFDVTETAVHALTNIGTAEMFLGNQRDGQAMLEDSLKRAVDAGLDDDVGRAYSNLISRAVTRRERTAAAGYLAAGLAYCDEHDLPSYGGYLRSWQARLDLEAGRWDRASELVLAELANPGSSVPVKIMMRVIGGLLAVRSGDEQRGRSHLDEAFRLAATTGELQRLAPVAAARAEAAWLRGATTEIDEVTAAASALAAKREQPWELGELAIWRSRAGLTTPSGPIAAPFAAELEGDHRTAASLWDELGCPYEAALARAASADESELRVALATLHGLGALPAARILARRLRELGVRDIPRGPRQDTIANPAMLTARELEVLALLASGATDNEIASQLFLSQKTVHHHVSTILRKLEVRNRTEASAAAVRLGIF